MKSSGESRLFAIILVVALLLVGVAVAPLILNKQPTGPGNEDKPVVVPDHDRSYFVPKDSHMKGKPDAPYSLVVFSDFQCHMCQTVDKELKKLLAKYQDRLNLVYHHFKAAQQHMHSETLAEAAEAAGEQGKFWEMHDRLFENTDKYQTMSMQDVTDYLMKLASDLKLDVLKFREALTGARTRTKVQNDMAMGMDLNINSTPTIYFLKPKGKPIKLPTLSGALTEFVNDPKNWQ